MKKLSAIIVAMQKYMDGHINEIMEHRKFCHWIQQQEETFDDYLISLRVSQNVHILFWYLHAKSIRDQIIEGLHDGDTVEDLL